MKAQMKQGLLLCCVPRGAPDSSWRNSTTSSCGSSAAATEARKIVNHRIISALIPNWEGQVNVRHYEFKGEVLVLSSPPMIVNGRQGRSVLHWRRCSAL